jgi:UDP-glucuronate 4-epimerase
MKILVTGGHGFIGQHLARRLVDDGHDVTICDRNHPSTFEPAICDLEIKDVRLYMRELKTEDSMKSLYTDTKPFDYIFHLAATPRIAVGYAIPESVLTNNIESLIDVLGYCRVHPATKLIFTSSSTVVWADTTENPYAASKKMCEELITLYRKTYGVQGIIARLYSVYGPGEANYGTASTLLKNVKMNLDLGFPIDIYGNGEAIRDFTHVADVVSGLCEIMYEAEDGTGMKVYELGGGGKYHYSVGEIVKAMVPEGYPINYKPARRGDVARTECDVNYWPIRWFPIHDVLEYIHQWVQEGRPND